MMQQASSSTTTWYELFLHQKPRTIECWRSRLAWRGLVSLPQCCRSDIGPQPRASSWRRITFSSMESVARRRRGSSSSGTETASSGTREGEEGRPRVGLNF
ncbi:unnamed protein product [Amoebophrya sp. A25]|nr:unnamed protein product [Amoebophrya sp. A25]|eukprot:GSA25T00023908001.1